MTLPLDEPWSSALTIPHDQVRVTFAYPWEGMLLLGTTDTPYEGDPADVVATDEDVDTVLVRGRRRGRPGPAAQGAGARDLRRPARAAAQRRLHRRRAARDRDPGGQGRHADGRGRQAHDLPAHRPRRAPAARAHARARQVDLPRCRSPVRPTPATWQPASSAAGSLEPAVAAHLAHFYGARRTGW